ncbi:energy transducer TonB [Saccharicrinis sp. GN24d3]|uniref:energy transducer TonB n=1 Tax=Saccharicrinis sp. GN24d3 TaxID=3458416 RepID=UPI004035E68A
MKNTIVFLLCITFSIAALGQDIKGTLLPEIKVTPPIFMGMENFVKTIEAEETHSITQYLGEHFQYPEDMGFIFFGTEVVKFTVNPNGELINYHIINSIGFPIDDEIIRLLKTTNGMWKPGLNNGEAVEMEKEVAMEIKVGQTKNLALYLDFTSKTLHSYKKGSKALIIKGNAKKALTHFNNAMRYRPYEKTNLLMRGLCRYELGDADGARQDWVRLKELGGYDIEPEYFAEIKKLKGYQEFAFMYLKQ